MSINLSFPKIETLHFVSITTVGGIALAAATLPAAIVPLASACVPSLASRTFNWIQSQSVASPTVSIREMADLAKHRKSEFCKRIPAEEWEKILNKIDSLNHRVSQGEFEAFCLGQWDHPIFCQKNWIYLAFQAFLEDRLTLDRMCVLFLYDECQKQTVRDSDLDPNRKGKSIFEQYFPSFYPKAADRIETFQLFDANGNRNAQAYELLKEHSHLNDLEFEIFINSLSKLSPEQTQFFLIKNKLVSDDLRGCC